MLVVEVISRVVSSELNNKGWVKIYICKNK